MNATGRFYTQTHARRIYEFEIFIMIKQVLSYGVLGCIMICIGLIDMFISINILHFSPHAVSFLHGAIVCLFAMENWTLLKDLREATQPIVKLIEQMESQKRDIEQLRKDNYNMDINNKCLETQVKYLKDTEKFTLAQWSKICEIRQKRSSESKLSIAKRGQQMQRSVSWQDLWTGNCRP